MLPISPISSPTFQGASKQTNKPALRFGEDIFEIQKQLRQEAIDNAIKARKEQRIQQRNQRNQKIQQLDKEFKAICDEIVWEGTVGGKVQTASVAQMVALLCKIRLDEDWPGYGPVEDLTNDFHGLDIQALRKAFNTLHDLNYLGESLNRYWLQPSGEAMLKELYPDVTIPLEEKERYISSSEPKCYLEERMWPTTL